MAQNAHACKVLFDATRFYVYLASSDGGLRPAPGKESPVATNEQVQQYFDALLASYDILTTAVENASERGAKISRQLAADVSKGQRDAIELGRKFAAEPTDLGQFYTALLEATTAAQARALAFSQVAYSEALGASVDTRATIEKLVDANRETSKAALEVARRFTAANPVTEAWRKGFEAFTPQGARKSAPKEKATA